MMGLNKRPISVIFKGRGFKAHDFWFRLVQFFGVRRLDFLQKILFAKTMSKNACKNIKIWLSCFKFSKINFSKIRSEENAKKTAYFEVFWPQTFTFLVLNTYVSYYDHMISTNVLFLMPFQNYWNLAKR